jgi:hypothetical protein
MLNNQNMEHQGEIILYHPDKEVKLEVRLESETVWLNRQQLAELFARDVKTIGKHINNALKEELADMATVAKFAIVQNEGGRTVTRQVEYYNLDMILSVGYRVKSTRGIEFRRWSNNVLKNHLLKGYSINQRLKELEEKVDAKFVKVEDLYNTYMERRSQLSEASQMANEENILNLEREAQEYQESLFGAEGELMKKRVALIQPIQQKVFAAIEEYAKLKGLDVIIDKAQNATILYYSPKADHTQGVIDLLKKK